MQNFILKFQAVAQKKTNNFGGLLFCCIVYKKITGPWTGHFSNMAYYTALDQFCTVL